MDDPVHVDIYSKLDALDRRITMHLENYERWHWVIEKRLAKNTEITTQVRDILTSFRILAIFAKWVAAIAACVAAVVAAWNAVFK